MGEYVKHNGESVKIGTCENMCYTSYERFVNELPNLEKEEYSAEPKEYLNSPNSTYWRFPFEDEKNIPFCSVENSDRKYVFEMTYDSLIALIPEIEKHIEKQDSYIVSIGQQIELNNHLMPCFTVSKNYNLWFCECKEDVDFLIQAIRNSKHEHENSEIDIFISQLEYYAKTDIKDFTAERYENHTDTAEDFLSLFNEIEVKQEQTISEKDKEYCERLQTYLDDTLKQQNTWYKYLLEASQLELRHNDYYSRDEEGKINKKSYYHYEDKDLAYFKSCMFTPLYDLKHIERLRANAIREFEDKIITYFNTAYQLRMSTKTELFEDKPMDFMPHYSELINYIMDYLEGKTFKQVADDYIVSDFRNAVRHPEIKASTLIIQNMIYTSWYSRYLDRDSYCKIEKLCRAIGYFEHRANDYEIGDVLIGFDHNNPRFNENYKVQSSKIVSMKFYQNNRLDVKFADKQTVQEFYDFYKLYAL